jgi:hypothetical protein
VPLLLSSPGSMYIRVFAAATQTDERVRCSAAEHYNARKRSRWVCGGGRGLPKSRPRTHGPLREKAKQLLGYCISGTEEGLLYRCWLLTT